MRHSSVVDEIKLFAFCSANFNTDSKVFDKTFKFYVAIRIKNFLSLKDFLIGSKIYIFQYKTSVINAYDVDNHIKDFVFLLESFYLVLLKMSDWL